jgi:hypothetical protein
LARHGEMIWTESTCLCVIARIMTVVSPPGPRAHSFGCAWYCFALAPPFGAQNLVMSKTRATDTNALSGARVRRNPCAAAALEAQTVTRLRFRAPVAGGFLGQRQICSISNRSQSLQRRRQCPTQTRRRRRQRLTQTRRRRRQCRRQMRLRWRQHPTASHWLHWRQRPMPNHIHRSMAREGCARKQVAHLLNMKQHRNRFPKV